MKKIVKGFIVCFSLYSIIPMPKIKWDENSIKYSFCFIPAIGFVTSLFSILWYNISKHLEINVLLYSSIASIIDVLISGAIHLDGFIDTSDAIFSCEEKEKKIEILKDPHVGAFGIVCAIIYFLVSLGVFSEIYSKSVNIYMIILPYTLSRLLGAYSIIAIKPAKNSGLAYTFYSMNNKNAVKIIFIFYALASTIILFFAFKSIIPFTILVSLIIYFLIFKIYTIRNFGGFTGDLAGFSISTFELISIAIIAFI